MKHALLLFMALLCLEISVNAQTELWSMAPAGEIMEMGLFIKFHPTEQLIHLFTIF